MIRISSAGKIASRYTPLGFTSLMHVILMCLFLGACHPQEFNSAEELRAFVTEPNNNLTQKIILNGYEVDVSFEPNDLLIYHEIGGEPADHQRLSNLERKYEDQYYFVIRLVKKDTASQPGAGAESASLRDLSGNITDFLSVTTSEEDTFKSDEVVLEDTNVPNKSAAEITIRLSKKKSLSREWIKFNLNEFGLGIGNHEFKFYVRDLERVPKLRFEIIS